MRLVAEAKILSQVRHRQAHVLSQPRTRDRHASLGQVRREAGSGGDAELPGELEAAQVDLARHIFQAQDATELSVDESQGALQLVWGERIDPLWGLRAALGRVLFFLRASRCHGQPASSVLPDDGCGHARKAVLC
ncbi:hypothetical protein [Pseudoxanthomonas sp. GM95]|uniref:hypothetical protein n=1 Tax=Pseudoxanthomonas sp. GM95 TaxID=1881043 RepID=UPI0015877EC0|nr:hypothetical protein [Pseudoxanthomonas sp. GM95]